MACLLKWRRKMQDRCYHCDLGLLLPDGSVWCQLTTSPRNICSEYSVGSMRLYKKEKIELPKKTVKVKVKEVKRPITKPVIPAKRNKKIISQQQKLF